jgi:hypothetical protein
MPLPLIRHFVTPSPTREEGGAASLFEHKNRELWNPDGFTGSPSPLVGEGARRADEG